ncbi:MAG: hypothetical protein JO339_02190 [Alphaproteobacteria bacterium]|nr:hypothetical protein [Alphaproteobacteria bacterium]
MKLASTRVNETIDFIGTNGNFSPVRRQAVAQFCRTTYPKLSLLDFGPYSSEFHTLSSDMSVKQHATVPAGNQTERAKRRAIFLIWKSIDKAYLAGTLPAAQAAMTMPTAQLDNVLADAMRKAAVCASAAGAADVFNELTTAPAGFLASNRLIVLGSPKGASKFRNLNSASYTNVRDFKFQYDPVNDGFMLGVDAMGNYGAFHLVKAVSVPAIAWYDVPGNGGEQAPAQSANFAQILGCELSGANFMLTTQFTGCAFCWTTDPAGVVRAAHIGPTKPSFVDPSLATSYPGKGRALAQRMIDQGGAPPLGIGVAAGMANAPGAALQVFGRGVGNASAVGNANPFYPDNNLKQATIIGRNAGGWELYLQTIALATNQIGEARQIL